MSEANVLTADVIAGNGPWHGYSCPICKYHSVMSCSCGEQEIKDFVARQAARSESPG